MISLKGLNINNNQEPKIQTWEEDNYTDDPELPEVKSLKLVKDFLPAPEALAKAEELVRVTISLSKTSVEFFKRVADENNVPYQRMIRSLLDGYASNYNKKS